MKSIRFMAALAFAALQVLPAFADWQLNNDFSRLSFISTKAGNVGEVHRFGKLSGTVSPDGAATVHVHLVSVDTRIGIRDERMREHLFETDKFPTAELSTEIDPARIEALPAGQMQALSQDIRVKLHGREAVVPAELLVTRVAPDRLLVTSAAPVIVNAGQFALSEGVEKLRQIAGLPAISLSVPVTFQLVFERQ